MYFRNHKSTVRRFAGAFLFGVLLASKPSILMAEEPLAMSPLQSQLLSIADQAEPKVIAWRRHIH